MFSHSGLYGSPRERDAKAKRSAMEGAANQVMGKLPTLLEVAGSVVVDIGIPMAKTAFPVLTKVVQKAQTAQADVEGCKRLVGSVEELANVILEIPDPENIPAPMQRSLYTLFEQWKVIGTKLDVLEILRRDTDARELSILVKELEDSLAAFQLSYQSEERWHWGGNYPPNHQFERPTEPTYNPSNLRGHTEPYQRDFIPARQAWSSASPSSWAMKPPAPQLLYVSGDVLGHGSQGTVVFKGTFQGRQVAVKRVMKNLVDIVEREVKILEASDHHPNVIRYYYREEHASFDYIALDLCPATLAGIIGRPDKFSGIRATFKSTRALQQITCGLEHLHTLNIIHRDIKPHNILVSPARRGANGGIYHDMLISDFGLCKKLADNETSYAQSIINAGTAGWRAPEVLGGEVKIGGGVDAVASTGRLRKSVDIFPLGCVYYYVLTDGGHPFGEYVRRDVNILDDAKSLEGLRRKDGIEAVSLISRMLSHTASDRPDTSACLLHPYFWSPERRLDFLQAVSDWFEQFRRLPEDPRLVELESGAADVVGNDWKAALDPDFVANLGAQRRSGYNGSSVGDLIRVIRNKKHHYHELPLDVKALVGAVPKGFLSYFTRRFPRLIMYVYDVVSKLSATEEEVFWSYYHASK